MTPLYRKKRVKHGETGGRYIFGGFIYIPCEIIEDRGKDFFGPRYIIIAEGRKQFVYDGEIKF